MLYSCYSRAIDLLDEFLGVLFACYKLSQVLLDELSHVVVLVLGSVIWIYFDFGYWFCI